MPTLYNISVEFMKKSYFVYILATQRNGTFYVGITADLVRRIWEHKQGAVDGFTKKYGVKNLVYYEVFNDPESAIKREKRLKKWSRESKMKAIEKINPEWKDLYELIAK